MSASLYAIAIGIQGMSALSRKRQMDKSKEASEAFGKIRAEAITESAKSQEDSLKMSENIQEIIDDINEVETLSTANGTSVLSIEDDLEKLVHVASSLQKTIDEFKS